MVKILVTGSTGFLGRALLKVLDPKSTVLLTRSSVSGEFPFFVKELNEKENYAAALTGVDVVIHCAARAHVMRDCEQDPLAVYRKVNTAGTLNLAEQAAMAGVKRFIFISSVKVNGESTAAGVSFDEKSEVRPEDAYGISKKEAEEAIQRVGAKTGMEFVIIRPALIYGEGVKANFYKLMRLARSGLPLPFGRIDNARSLIYVGNLVDFIIACVTHPNAANQIFLLSDGKDLSLRQLLIKLRRCMGKSPNLFPVPTWVFGWLGLVLKRRPVIKRLVGSLQINSEKARTDLSWKPPYSVDKGLSNTVKSFIEGN